MKIRDLMGLVVLSVILSGCIGPESDGTVNVTQTTLLDTTLKAETTQTTVKPTETTVLSANDVEFEQHLQEYKQKRLFKDGNAVPDRAAYGVSTLIFAQLPPVPNDFLYTVYLMKYGKFVDVATLGPEYYTQPEFDPDFTKFGLRYWNEWKKDGFSKTHWGTVGYRAYPFSQHVVAKPGFSFNVTLFLSSDWNVETYQGVRVVPKFITSATSEDGKTIFSSPDADKYINVNVTPNEFLLTPAFPQFTPDWVKKLTFTGKIADNTPSGTYILSMKMDKPTTENSDRWLLEYLNLYSEGSDTILTDKPMLQAFIYVQ